MQQNWKRVGWTTMSFLFFAVPVFAQEGGTKAGGGWMDNGLHGIAIGVGMALAAGLAALGDSRAIAAACEGVARNPGAGARIQTMMLIGLVLIETLVLFTFAMIFLKFP
ncbi:MAG: ATPase [Acidobacteria bacterium]|nr:ATPase [Acidobacteriota bacterium]